MRRTAFTLMELLAVLPLIAAAGLLFGMLFTEMVRDVPQMQAVAYASGDIQTVLTAMQRDFDSAASLPPSVNGQSADEALLWLATDGRVLRWQIKDGQISRDEYDAGADLRHLRQTQWPLRLARLRFERLPDAQAVAVHSAVQYRTRGQGHDRLVNTRILRIEAVPGYREEP